MPATSGAGSGNSNSPPSQSPSPSILDVLHKYRYTKKNGSDDERLKQVSSRSKAATEATGMENGASLDGKTLHVSPQTNENDAPCIPETPESDIPSPGSPVIAPTFQKRIGRALSSDSEESKVPQAGRNQTQAGSKLEGASDSTLNHSHPSRKKLTKNTDSEDSESPLPPSFLSKERKKSSPFPKKSSHNRVVRLESSSDSDDATPDSIPAATSSRSCHTISQSESDSEDDRRSKAKNHTIKPQCKTNKRGVIFISDDEDEDGQQPSIHCDDEASSSRPPNLKKGRFVIGSDEEELNKSSTKTDGGGGKGKTKQGKRAIVFVSDDEDNNVVEISDASNTQSESSSSESEKESTASNSESETAEERSGRSSPAVTNQRKKIFDVAKFKSAIAEGRTVPKANRVADQKWRRNQTDLLFSEERKRRELPVYDSDDDGPSNRCENPERVAVTSFFNSAPVEDLMCIPGCRQAKLDLLLSLRPFRSWTDLLRKVRNGKSLSTDMLNGAQEVMTVRSVVMGLMKRCEKISAEIEQLVGGLMDGSQAGQIAEQPSVLNPNVRLASYQLLGLNWLALMHRQNLNGILADEMGLGKTIQAISFLSHLLEEGDHGPHLIVVPSSTLENWVRELHTWCRTLKVIVYYGSQDQRRQIRHEILQRGNSDFHVLVTTYNIVSSSEYDKKLIKRIGFHYVIFDEAHMLKNMTSLRFKNLMKIMARRRLLLTGTPLQNNLVELMSLLIFVMPDIFYGKTEEIKQLFSRKNFGDVEEPIHFERERIEHAKRIMRPFVLRRLKKDVLSDLPQKLEQIESCPLSESQRKLYDNLISSFSKQVRENQKSITNSGMGMMMQLRKMANHPLLLRNRYTGDMLRKLASLMLNEPTHREADANLIFEDMEVMSDFELHGLCCLYKSVAKYKLDTDVILESGKFQYLDRVLPELKEKGHRVLLFSQFTMVLDIIEWYMKHRKYSFLRLDGQTRVDVRQELIDQYNNEDIFVFLLSTRAGGLGINLTTADKVIIHDIDFNPYNDKQAEDRCHRVGQTKEVSVIRLVSSNTIEEGILRCAQEKLKLEQDVTGTQADSEKESKNDVVTLLKAALRL